MYYYLIILKFKAINKKKKKKLLYYMIIYIIYRKLGAKTFVVFPYSAADILLNTSLANFSK